MGPGYVPHLVPLLLLDGLQRGYNCQSDHLVPLHSLQRLTWVDRNISSQVEVLHPVIELAASLLVVGQLAPLHEDEGDELTNLVLQDLRLQSLALVPFHVDLQDDDLALYGVQYVPHHNGLQRRLQTFH